MTSTRVLRLLPLILIILPLGGVLALAKTNISHIQETEVTVAPSAQVLGERDVELILARQRALLASSELEETPPARAATAALTPSSTVKSALPAFLARGSRLLLGVETKDGPYRIGQAQRFQRQIEHPLDLVQYSRSFAHGFEPQLVDRVVKNGALPVVTWEPWLASRGLASIAAGKYDSYLTKFARGVRAYHHPLLLRFGPEMNGDWNPWSEQTNGHRPGDFVRAWRHVHQLFELLGASNVVWVWSPNIAYPGSTPIKGLYPGDQYVDLIGLDGYNWGTVNTWNTWKSFNQVFGTTLTQVRRIAPTKPVIISETGSTESGGDKASWIRSAFITIANDPDYKNVVGLVWYDQNKETDWRAASSPTALKAFRNIAGTLPRTRAASELRQLLADREIPTVLPGKKPNER